MLLSSARGAPVDGCHARDAGRSTQLVVQVSEGPVRAVGDGRRTAARFHRCVHSSWVRVALRSTIEVSPRRTRAQNSLSSVAWGGPATPGSRSLGGGSRTSSGRSARCCGSLRVRSALRAPGGVDDLYGDASSAARHSYSSQHQRVIQSEVRPASARRRGDLPRAVPQGQREISVVGRSVADPSHRTRSRLVLVNRSSPLLSQSSVNIAVGESRQSADRHSCARRAQVEQL